MFALAPGKLVLSGAYSVLEGAPAVVTAVDRYVIADASRPASFATPEVCAALELGPYRAKNAHHPWFDAAQLRHGDQKLGLGSSAAIVVSCLAALEIRSSNSAPSDIQLRDTVFAPALEAHRRAQNGGSGIDVAAAAYGGTLIATLERTTTLSSCISHDSSPAPMKIEQISLPEGLRIDVWFCGKSASTRNNLARLKAFRERAPGHAKRLMDAQSEASEQAAAAIRENHALQFIAALSKQCQCLDELGAAIGADIVTEDVRFLNKIAETEQGVVLPSGAGGGDVAIFAAMTPPSSKLLMAAAQRNQMRLDNLKIGARGVHASE